jgi:hypothetical protein
MPCTKRWSCLLLVVALVSTAGCSSETSTYVDPAKLVKPPMPATPAVAPVLKPDVPQTPEAAVEAVVDGLKASKPIVVWETLPASAQKGLSSGVSTMAHGVDQEVWQQTVVNLKKLVTLLETKKEDILASPIWKSGQLPKLETVKASWDPSVKLLRIIVDSELVDHEKMSSFDGAEFLKGTGAKIFAQLRDVTKTMKPDPLAFIDTAKCKVEKQSDSSAKVTITWPDPNAKPIHLGLAVIDGKWSSTQLNMGAAMGSFFLQTYLEPFRPYQMLEWKPAYLKDMEKLGKILDKLQSAKTSDEFQTVMSRQLMQFVVAKALQLRAKGPKRTPLETVSFERKANTAMIVVKGLHAMDEPTYHDLTKSLRALDPDQFRGPMEIEGSSVFFVGPIDAVYDKTLQAIKVGNIVSKDKLRDTVVVELPTSVKDEKTTAEADAKSK